MSATEDQEETKEGYHQEMRKSSRLVPIEDFLNLLQNESRHTLVSIKQDPDEDCRSTFQMTSQKQEAANYFKESMKQSGIRMRDTFSKLHHNFSIPTSENEGEDDDEQNNLFGDNMGD